MVFTIVVWVCKEERKIDDKFMSNKSFGGIIWCKRIMAREINSFFEGIFQTRTSQTLKAAYLCKIDRKNATFVHLLKAQMFAQEPLFSYRSFSVSDTIITSPWCSTIKFYTNVLFLATTSNRANQFCHIKILIGGLAER